MDNSSFQLRWDEDGRMIADTDQIAAENLMYLAQDIVGHVSYAETSGGQDEVECVTEEVITDDWVQPGGQERVEVPMDQLSHPTLELKNEIEIDVPLPTDQDMYTAMRPYPCDFCSRRFRKKAALMNHMVAHQNDRPHACNLCGMRYVRKSDLMHHLKSHAFVPEHEEQDYAQDYEVGGELLEVRKKKRGRKKKNPPKEEESESWENMTSARTQQWSRRPAPAKAPPPRTPTPPPATPTPPPAIEPTDPRRPFVCQQCGVGFAREKALQSHARVHGGESPVECSRCGELCWSRESLANHMRLRHAHLGPAPAPEREPSPFQHSDTSYEEELEYSSEPEPVEERPERARGHRGDVQLAPELYCRDCGVAFQRVDLLRRHVVAAHSHKRHDSETVGSDVSGAEHACDVCGESCTDALQLLAHAEGHARDSSGRKRSSGSGRSFPCRVCGKIFGSRSSQQIHVRIHTGERPYGCRFCWKAFADGGTLRKHERIHTGEKPYACAVCPRAFNQRVVLREHVRSHHSAPDHRRSGGSSYECPVCGVAMMSSSELVQHLIEHCDANTALRRQPQSGPRKYKRRRKLKSEEQEEDWPSPSPPPRERTPSPSPPPPPPQRRVRRRARKPPPPRPKMIHTEEPTARPRTKNVRSGGVHRAPPATFPVLSTEPADDLRAILPQSNSAVNVLEQRLEEIPQIHNKQHLPKSKPTQAHKIKQETLVEIVKHEVESEEEGCFRCEMCSLEFKRRSDLLLHVPVHI